MSNWWRLYNVFLFMSIKIKVLVMVFHLTLPTSEFQTTSLLCNPLLSTDWVEKNFKSEVFGRNSHLKENIYLNVSYQSDYYSLIEFSHHSDWENFPLRDVFVVKTFSRVIGLFRFCSLFTCWHVTLLYLRRFVSG
jgi:hypothetical protein